MPSTANIDQHQSVAFVEAEEQVPPGEQFTATWAPDGRRVTVSGQCPACHGRTSTEFSPGIGGTKGFRGQTQPRPIVLPAPVTVYCECGHAHADRPPEAFDRGCGRYWPVYLPDGVRRPPVPGAAQPSTVAPVQP